jgi:hypothetical protein
MNHTLKLGIIVLAVAAVATAGVALAIDGNDEPLFASPVSDELADDEAADWDPRAAADRIRDRLQPLVEDEVIDDEQADAVADHLAEAGPRPGFGHHRGGARLHAGAAAVAEFLGMEPEELRDLLSEGATIGDILEERGVTAEDLVTHLLTGIEERLGDAVADGRITEDQKAEALERARTQLTDLIEDGFPVLPDGSRPGGHHRGPHHFTPHGPRFGDAPDAEDASQGI